MPNTIESYRIFIASPGGLSDERQAFRDEIEIFNRIAARREHVQFEAVGWEETLGGMGRPQSKINQDLRGCDFFVLMLCDRWGMHPGGDSGYTSGTEEEYYEAMQCVEAGTMREVVIMFKPVAIKQLSDPGKQLAEVLKFKKKIEEERKHLYETFDSIERYREILRAHLYNWLSDLKNIDNKKDEEKANLGEAKNLPNIPESKTSSNDKTNSINIEAERQKAWSLANAGKLTEAEIIFARIIINSQDFSSLVSYSQFLSRLGLLDRAEGMLNEAIRIANEQDVDITKPNFGYFSDLSTIHIDLGGIEMRRGNIEKSLAIYKNSLSLAMKGGNPYLVGYCYLKLGDLKFAQSKFDDALIMYNKSLKEHKEFNILDAMAVDYMAIAQAYYRKGVTEKALKFITDSRNLYLSAKGADSEDWFVADNSGMLGQIYERKREFDKAEELYKVSLRINKKLGRNNDIAASYGCLGHLYKVQGRLDEAEKMQRTALELEEKTNYMLGIAISCVNIGDILRKRKDLDGAEIMLRRGMEAFKNAGLPHRVAEVQKEINEVLAENGKINTSVGNDTNRTLYAQEVIEKMHALDIALEEINKKHRDYFSGIKSAHTDGEVSSLNDFILIQWDNNGASLGILPSLRADISEEANQAFMKAMGTKAQ